MRCLVTGCAGFLGSHLSEKLLDEGHEVWGIDNLTVGRESNMSGFISHKNFHFFKSDILDKRVKLQRLFDKVDWVFHLAARADIVPSIKEPALYHDTNVNGTVRMLELAKENKVKRFIYAASSSCYGIASVLPTPEDAECQPMYPYALTKYIGEQYVMHWAQVYKLSCLSLRFFNVFGPRARTSGSYGAVFGVFLAQLLNGKPLTVVGDGTQTRDFTYVTDAVDALLAAANSHLSGMVMNVGSGETHSVNEIIDLLKPEKIEYIPKRPGEPECTFADISRIQQCLKWKPGTGFKRGIELLLESKREFKNAPVWTAESIKEATKEWFDFLGD